MKSCGTHVTFVYCDSILCFRIAIIAQKEIAVTTCTHWLDVLSNYTDERGGVDKRYKRLSQSI